MFDVTWAFENANINQPYLHAFKIFLLRNKQCVNNGIAFLTYSRVCGVKPNPRIHGLGKFI